ncbi:hypothetical protein ACFL96_03220 [Thermoproteota archaeon]
MIRKILRKRKFRKIFDIYEQIDSKEVEKKGNAIKDTEHGLFVPSSMNHVFDFFEEIGLDKYKNFLDLGSGDSRIVLIASLFTQAAGIESDDELHKRGILIKNKLKLNADLVKANFIEKDISKYDAIYMYPDKHFTTELNRKISKELNGDLLLYSNTFLPSGLKIKETKIDWLKFCICKK